MIRRKCIIWYPHMFFSCLFQLIKYEFVTFLLESSQRSNYLLVNMYFCMYWICIDSMCQIAVKPSIPQPHRKFFFILSVSFLPFLRKSVARQISNFLSFHSNLLQIVSQWTSFKLQIWTFCQGWIIYIA